MVYQIVKRAFDIAASLVLIVLFLPVWILVPILIVLDNKGPIFFTQKRVGQNGKSFQIFKFRTMIKDADEFWKTHPDLYEKFKKESWKLKLEEDPRITKMGRVLRQTSIDEFPQVFNILMGSMSLIGPRPIRDIEVKDALKRYGTSIQKDIDTALSAKPGLSGIWQVSGRNDVPWDQRIRLDARYAANQNIIDDLKIIVKTPLAMISKWWSLVVDAIVYTESMEIKKIGKKLDLPKYETKKFNKKEFMELAKKVKEIVEKEKQEGFLQDEYGRSPRYSF